VPDLTTTVLAPTLTGIAADSRLAGGKRGHPGRRVIAVTAMFSGALLGALLVINIEQIACTQAKSGSTNGGGEIRTLGTPIRRTTVFETAAFNRSATPPG
jgi:hypothetical protein